LDPNQDNMVLRSEQTCPPPPRWQLFVLLFTVQILQRAQNQQTNTDSGDDIDQKLDAS